MEYTDDYGLKLQEIEELKKAVKIKRLNEELLEHLTSTLSWLIRTCEKNNMPVPKKETIVKSIDRAYDYLDRIPSDQPKVTGTKQPKTKQNPLGGSVKSASGFSCVNCRWVGF